VLVATYHHIDNSYRMLFSNEVSETLFEGYHCDGVANLIMTYHLLLGTNMAKERRNQHRQGLHCHIHCLAIQDSDFIVR
jgi:hypothetical protein